MRTAALAALAGAAAAQPCLAADAAQGRTVGFLVTNFVHALYSGPLQEDCPQGLATKPQVDALLARLPKAERQRIQLKENEKDLQALLGRRGPEGLNLCRHPTAVPDPGMRISQAKTGIGLDLDGAAGPAPGNCNQQAFTSPDGQPGIDNQYARVMGCTFGLRSKEGPEGGLGPLATTYQQLYLEAGRAMLIELTEVDSLADDPDVGVRLYTSRTGIQKGADGKPLPYTSISIEADSYWHSSTRGRIAGGVLTTDPADVHLKDFILRPPGITGYRSARLRLSIDAKAGTATGLMGAYHDLQQLYQNVLNPPGEQVNGMTCEALYHALQRSADGLPDAGGTCTAISAAYHVGAIPAFIIHPAAAQQASAPANGGP